MVELSKAWAPLRIWSKILWFAFFLIVLLIAIFGSIVMFTFFSSLFTPTGATRVAMVLENVPILKHAPRAAIAILEAAQLKPETKEVGVEEHQQENFGIFVTQFKPMQGVVYPNQPVYLTATLSVEKIPEEKVITLDFSKACYVENYTGAITVEPKQLMVDHTWEGSTQTVSCTFENGFQLEEDKSEGSVIVRFIPTFFYSQTVVWQPYAKSFHEPTDKPLQPSYGSSKGPIEIVLGSQNSQPFYSDMNYVLYLKVKSDWDGGLKEIKDLKLFVPSGVELEVNSPGCNFIKVGGYYTLTNDALEKTNVDCSALKALSAELLVHINNVIRGKYGTLSKKVPSYRECVEQYKKEFTYFCPFRVYTTEMQPSKIQFKAEVDYVYQLHKPTIVDIIALPTS